MRTLPSPRGPISELLLDGLRDEPGTLGSVALSGFDDALCDEDLQFALYLCYELHYRGLPGVDERWEWNPSVLRFRDRLESAFMDGVFEAVGAPSVDMSASEMRDELIALTGPADGPSISGHMVER